MVWSTNAQPELAMTVTKSLAELQQEHAVMELEGIDRMYLNAYVPQLTSEGGIAAFCRGYLGHRFASTKQAVAMTEAFKASIATFIDQEGLALVHFKKGQRKDDVFQKKLRQFHKEEGVVFVGVAQEKARVPRTTRRQLEGGGTIPWIMYSTALVNFYYFYGKDRDLGPFFIKFCSYFPYPAKLCLNGHEYLKCQLTQRGVAFEALGVGIVGGGFAAVLARRDANVDAWIDLALALHARQRALRFAEDVVGRQACGGKCVQFGLVTVVQEVIVEPEQLFFGHVAKHRRAHVANEVGVAFAAAVVVDHHLQEVRLRRQVGVAAGRAEDRVEGVDVFEVKAQPQAGAHALHGGVDLGKHLVFHRVEQSVPGDDLGPLDQEAPELDEISVARPLALERRLNKLVEVPLPLSGPVEVQAPFLRRSLMMLAKARDAG